MNEFAQLYLTYSAATANRKLAQIAEASTWTEAMKEEFQRQRFIAIAERKVRLAAERRIARKLCFWLIAAFAGAAILAHLL